MKNIGILGGTFDPIHIGHLLMAEEVYKQLQFDEIWFIPSYTPPHKADATIAGEHRLKMVELAIQDNDHFRVLDIELTRKEKSYTIHTIQELKQLYPSNQFYFIIGADMVEFLPNWYKIDELVKMVQFVGVKRPGYERKTIYPIIEADVPQIDISSTVLRNRLNNGELPRYWLPEKVRDYIRENRLYGCCGSTKNR